MAGAGDAGDYTRAMHLPVQINVAQYPQSVRRFMGIAWILIVVKCVVVWWAMLHWNVPLHPMWIVGPTLIFATLASVIWLTHRPD